MNSKEVCTCMFFGYTGTVRKLKQQMKAFSKKVSPTLLVPSLFFQSYFNSKMYMISHFKNISKIRI